MKNILLLTAMVFLLAGCGCASSVKRMVTGEPSEVCVNGVLYYQFVDGASPALDEEGKVLNCANE
jgi:hypothetical protein